MLRYCQCEDEEVVVEDGDNANVDEAQEVTEGRIDGGPII
jgi:hypothetical protein